MKGQRLFVRETTPDDADELRAFYAAESNGDEPPLDSSGVIGRLVGALVAHLTWRIETDRAVITHVLVASSLRRRRVGRALIQDAASLARSRNVARLVVAGDCAAREFFLRTGFAELGTELSMEVPRT